MINKSWFCFLILGLCLVSFAFIYGCGTNPTGGGGGGRGTYTYYGTEREFGNTVSITVGDGTFKASIESGPIAGVTFEGTFYTMASGVLSCEVTVSSSPTTIEVGSLFNAIEFQNVLLIAVLGESQDLLFCPTRATIEPTSPFSCNAIMIPWEGWDSQPSPGKFTYATIEATKTTDWQFDMIVYDIDGAVVSTNTDTGYTFSTTEGKFYKDDNSPVIFKTSSGAFVGTNGTNEGGFAGSLRGTMTTTEVLSHNYKGISHVVNPDTGDVDVGGLIIKSVPSLSKFHIFSFDPVSAAEEFQGTCEISAQNDDKVFPCTLSFIDLSPAPGWAQAAYVNGKILLCGISTVEYGPGDDRPLNFLLYQQ